MAQATPPAGRTQNAKPAEQMKQSTEETARPQMGSSTPLPPVQQGAVFTDWASI